MFDPAALFEQTLLDIERRLASTDAYERLMIAALLRKLFLDDFPLVDQVNKAHKIKLVFEIMETGDPLKEAIPPTVWSLQDGLDPDTAPPIGRKASVNRDQFLSKVVTICDGKTYSVRETILFEANVVGAVHAGAPKSEKEKALATVESTFRIGGHAMSLRQLSAIARVSLKALEPLRKASKTP